MINAGAFGTYFSTRRKTELRRARRNILSVFSVSSVLLRVEIKRRRRRMIPVSKKEPANAFYIIYAGSFAVDENLKLFLRELLFLLVLQACFYRKNL